VDTEPGAISSRPGTGNVSWGLEPHYEQTLDERQKLRGAPTPLFQNQVALKHSEVVNFVAFTEVVEKIGLVIAMNPLTYRLIVCLSDVEEPITIRM
jgi:hypothetical protein